MPSERLKTHFLGLELSSPFIVGSGPLGFDSSGIIRAHRAGAGAVTTKTIRDRPAENPRPHMAAAGGGSLLNSEQWSDLPGRAWIDAEIPRAKDAGAVVIASVGHTAAEAERWAPAALEAGADAVELVSYDEATLVPMVAAVRALTRRPVLAKVSPAWRDPAGAAAAAFAAGADAVTAIDSVGPVLSIDIETARPSLGGPGGHGWLSGAAIKPIALRHVAEIAARCGKPVLGLGGVAEAEDAVEMLMAGASAVGVCSSLILKGTGYLTVLNERLDALLERLGYADVAAVSGAALPFLDGRGSPEPAFSFEAGLCVACGACARCCAYAARTQAGKSVSLDEIACRRCGLCASVCRAGALRFGALRT